MNTQILPYLILPTVMIFSLIFSVIFARKYFRQRKDTKSKIYIEDQIMKTMSIIIDNEENVDTYNLAVVQYNAANDRKYIYEISSFFNSYPLYVCVFMFSLSLIYSVVIPEFVFGTKAYKQEQTQKLVDTKNVQEVAKKQLQLTGKTDSIFLIKRSINLGQIEEIHEKVLLLPPQKK